MPALLVVPPSKRKAGELRYPLRGLGSRNPIAALNKGGGLVRSSLGQPMFLSSCSPQQDRPEHRGGEAGHDRGFLLDFAAQLVDPFTHGAIHVLELPLHHPKRRIVSAVELLCFSLKALTDAGVGVVLVALPAHQHGLAHAIKTGTVALEVAPEGPIQEALGILARDSGVPEVELELAMNIGKVDVRQQATLFGHFLI